MTDSSYSLHYSFDNLALDIFLQVCNKVYSLVIVTTQSCEGLDLTVSYRLRKLHSIFQVCGCTVIRVQCSSIYIRPCGFNQGQGISQYSMVFKV